MLKNKFKTIAILLTIIMLISSFTIIVKATDNTPVVTSDEPETSNTTNEVSDSNTVIQPRTDENENQNENAELDILYEDLYIFDDSVTMDKIVDGNVYIFGNDVKITGKVNGNLFVFANEVTFTSSEENTTETTNNNYCYIAGSVYAFANKISFNAVTNDIYAACSDFNMSYDSYIMRDVRIYASDITLKGYITRDAYLYSDNINFGTKSDNEEDNDSALICGKLNYFSNSEITIPEGSVVGEVKYNSTANLDKNSTNTKTVSDYLMNLLNVIIYTFVIYLVLTWLMPKFFDKTSNELKTSSLLTLGIGLIALIATPIVGIILLCLTLLSLSTTLLTVYGILIAISFAVLASTLTYLLKDKFGFADKKWLLLLIITIILWALKQIPFVGSIISIVISIFGLGLIIKSIIDRNKDIEVKTENK